MNEPEDQYSSDELDELDEPDNERDVTCPECGGSGSDSWESFLPCPHCDGEGYQWWLT